MREEAGEATPAAGARIFGDALSAAGYSSVGEARLAALGESDDEKAVAARPKERGATPGPEGGRASAIPGAPIVAAVFGPGTGAPMPGQVTSRLSKPVNGPVDMPKMVDEFSWGTFASH